MVSDIPGLVLCNQLVDGVLEGWELGVEPLAHLWILAPLASKGKQHTWACSHPLSRYGLGLRQVCSSISHEDLTEALWRPCGGGDSACCWQDALGDGGLLPGSLIPLHPFGEVGGQRQDDRLLGGTVVLSRLFGLRQNGNKEEPGALHQ